MRQWMPSLPPRLRYLLAWITCGHAPCSAYTCVRSSASTATARRYRVLRRSFGIRDRHPAVRRRIESEHPFPRAPLRRRLPRRRPYGLAAAYGLYPAYGVSHATEDSTQRTVSHGRTCGRCVLCRCARRLCAKIPLALPLGPVASEFDLARRAAPAADAAMVGRSPGRVPRAPLRAAAERRAGRHVAGVFSQQLLRGAPRRLSHPPVDRRTAALR